MLDVELFIQAVRERPALYCPRHESFSKKEARTRLWNEIGAIVYPDWSTLGDSTKRSKVLTMQTKWKSLKDCFNRELRLQRVHQPLKPRKRYEFYEKLSFLLHKKNPDFSPDLPPPVEIKAEVLQEPAVDLDPPEPPPPPPQEPPEDSPRKRRLPQDAAADGAEDSDKMFLMSFVSDMKRLPLSTKYWVKMKFSQIMHEATMELVGDGEGSPGGAS